MSDYRDPTPIRFTMPGRKVPSDLAWGIAVGTHCAVCDELVEACTCPKGLEGSSSAVSRTKDLTLALTHKENTTLRRTREKYPTAYKEFVKKMGRKMADEIFSHVK